MPTFTGGTLVPSSMLYFHKTPIDNLPYDVIREIFIHCVSTYPFRQSNARFEPMLLTQICTSWRSIALECPTLWTHLYFCLTVAKSDIDGTQIIPKRQIELLRWWKGNHGLMMPHLFLRAQFEGHDITREYLPLEKSMYFILAYIASAQFLCMDRFYWTLISERIHSGDEIIFPRLRTLVSCDCYDNYDSISLHPELSLMGRISSPSSLRYLSLSVHYFPYPTIPNQWVALTHLSLRKMGLSEADWFTFIRSFPKLQWGSFHIELFGPVYNINPPRCALLELADIFITFNDRNNDSFRISFIFANLYLPSLRTLSFYALTESWKDIRSVTEIRTILKSTPAITTLILGPRFLSLDRPHHVKLFHQMNVVEPIWDIATQIIHLQLETDLFRLRSNFPVLDVFIKNAFLSNTGWLPLENPMCPIQKISIIDHGLLSLFNKPPEYASESLRELSGKIPNIKFELTSSSPRRNADEVWKDWH